MTLREDRTPLLVETAVSFFFFFSFCCLRKCHVRFFFFGPNFLICFLGGNLRKIGSVTDPIFLLFLFSSCSVGLPDDFPYEIKRPLGHGSFAAVYEGIDPKTKQRRAIKIIDLKKLQTKSHYAESEMKIMMVLQASKHPSVVGMYKAFKVNDASVALVLEFCDQGDLSSYVDQQEGKKLSEEMAKKLMQDLALGLSFLRSKNIIHRDLKPQNLLLKNCSRGLALKLADFGFAKELEDFNEVIPSLVGSPMYLAPELWNREGYTTQSDLWSVGVILYEIIFGHYLYFSKTIPGLINLVKNKDVEFPPGLGESVSPECLDLIRGLLQKDPEERLSWDKYLSHPWLDLDTRFFFNFNFSFFFLFFLFLFLFVSFLFFFSFFSSPSIVFIEKWSTLSMT